MNFSNSSAIYSSINSCSSLALLNPLYSADRFLKFCNSTSKFLPSLLNLALNSLFAIAKYCFCSSGVNSILNTEWNASWYLKPCVPTYIVPLIFTLPAISLSAIINAPAVIPLFFSLLPISFTLPTVINSGKFSLAQVIKASTFSVSTALKFSGNILYASPSNFFFASFTFSTAALYSLLSFSALPLFNP